MISGKSLTLLREISVPGESSPDNLANLIGRGFDVIVAEELTLDVSTVRYRRRHQLMPFI